MLLGIDCGKVFAKVVLLDKNNSIVKNWFIRHHGEVQQSLKRIITELSDYRDIITACGISGSFSDTVCELSGIEKIDEVSALVAGVKGLFSSVRNIINIGGSSLMFIELDEEGKFLNMTTNSLCAAGTGSFLDQQAIRLGINNSELDKFEMVLNPPEVATRCAVFAKTDIIHRQQEGFSKSEIWCGLCKGLSTTTLNTLLKGRKITGHTILTGGVVLNSEIQYYLKGMLGSSVIIPQNPHLLQAFGTARLARDNFAKLLQLTSVSVKMRTERNEKLMPPLVLERSRVPSFESKESYITSDGTEVRVLKDGSVSGVYFLGIDIGSTSTKAVLIDDASDVFADFYRKTEGDPIGATGKIFKSIEELKLRKNLSFKIRGVGSTGSGRKMIGELIGADSIVNEITAHASGALHFNPDIETIFEIGGQDSKYIHLKNGRVHLVNMNYVCAAGTGSFIEEQAIRLGFDVRHVGSIVRGIAPPITSDRCTVFMEEDLNRLLKKGYSKEEVMAAVMYSVVQNYLNKVVGNRPVSKVKIFFQGATARNAGLVAAFEKFLNREIVVNPSCHVMGAVGAALIAKQKVETKGQKTAFRGFDVFSREIKLTNETCKICSNVCRISYAEIEGFSEKPSWGYMCGREPEENKAKYKGHYDLFEYRDKLLLTIGVDKKKREYSRTVGIPWLLTLYTFMPLWRTFFNELGCNVKISPKTNEDLLKSGIELVQADMCLPIKVVYGHVKYLSKINGVDFIFLPHMIGGKKNRYTSNSYFCPYVQAVPAMIKSGMGLGLDLKPILSPVVDFREDDSWIVESLYLSLREFGFSQTMIKRAFKKAMAVQNRFTAMIQVKGKRTLEELKRNGKRGIVIVGRPYNVYDPRVNLNIPKKIAGMGFQVIPLDMIPFEPQNLGEEFKNMFWNYGQVIINALKVTSNYENLFPVYLTNFSCGPDSFLLTYAEEIAGKKPLLILELDEHGADAGYTTRLEAFVDSIESYIHEARDFSISIPPLKKKDIKDRKWLIPPMHPVGARLVASAMRGYRYNAVSLPDETPDVHLTGKALTRGGECVPAAVTIGNVVKFLKESSGNEKYALFMPTSTGPCRFGQYATLHRLILNKLGYSDLPIISPSAENAYYGLEMELRKDIWKAILSGDIIYKMRCKVKPYEAKKGETERIMEEAIRIMENAFEMRENYLYYLKNAIQLFEKVEVKDEKKPLVGVVGEIFVRCNPFSNGYVVEAIERFGGEVWLAPVSEWIQYTAYLHKTNAIESMKWNEIFRAIFKNRFIVNEEHKAYDTVKKWLSDREEPPIEFIVEEGARYLPKKFTAEAILTVGRALAFIRSGASLIVNTSPFTCMPGNISAAIFQKIQREFNIPIVNLFYDGDHSDNERLRPFMNNLKQSRDVNLDAVAV